jgi:hypothetical protein
MIEIPRYSGIDPDGTAESEAPIITAMPVPRSLCRYARSCPSAVELSYLPFPVFPKPGSLRPVGDCLVRGLTLVGSPRTSVPAAPPGSASSKTSTIPGRAASASVLHRLIFGSRPTCVRPEGFSRIRCITWLTICIVWFGIFRLWSGRLPTKRLFSSTKRVFLYHVTGGRGHGDAYSRPYDVPLQGRPFGFDFQPTSAEALKERQGFEAAPEPNLIVAGEYPGTPNSIVGLRVHLPTPAYMLAMKILVKRLVEDTEKIESDLNDAVALMKVTKLTTEHQLVDRLLRGWEIRLAVASCQHSMVDRPTGPAMNGVRLGLDRTVFHRCHTFRSVFLN